MVLSVVYALAQRLFGLVILRGRGEASKEEPIDGLLLVVVATSRCRTVPLDRATTARDIHTIVGLAACGVGVGLGPTRMRRLKRDDVRYCEVTSSVRLPDLQLSFREVDRSPVLAAFPNVVRAHCREVGSRLDEVLARHPAACPPGRD